MTPPHALFIFLDGVGLGPAGPDNPLSTLDLPVFARLAGGQPWTDALAPVRTDTLVVEALDATLGVDGLPQSGTGQTALFAGVNAAAIHGAHYGPTPPTTVRDVLERESVMAHVARRFGATSVAFANAFPDRFFAAVEPRQRWTATTRMARAAGVRLRRAADLAAGDAVAADLTGAGWHALFDPSLAEIDEATAAARLLALARAHRLTLFEVFHTDKAGHAQDPDAARDVLTALDRFFGALLDRLDPARDLLVVSSDHGNLEDLATRSHTRHRVPLVAWGAGAGAFAGAASLVDVAPALRRLLTGDVQMPSPLRPSASTGGPSPIPGAAPGQARNQEDARTDESGGRLKWRPGRDLNSRPPA